MSSGAWSNGPESRRAVPGPSSASQNDSEDFMSKLFTETVGNNVDKYTYKPSGNTVGTKGGQSNSKIGTMGSGKNFFVELQRQVDQLSAKEKAGG